MSDTYGEPNAKDGTARFDRIVDRSSKNYNYLVEATAKIINRPTGSKFMPLPEQREQYMTTRDVPEAQTEMLNQMVAMQGPVKGLMAYVDYVEAMENGALNDTE